MKKIGRNDPCPCGSGKKFKKCHMGREDELNLDGLGEISLEMSATITSLPEVSYGRSREIIDALDIKELTGSSIGVKFIDLKSYIDLNLFGSGRAKASERGSGGILINVYKSTKADPDNIYLAISRDIDDSTLIHEFAHVLDYLGGSGLMPGTLQALSFELNGKEIQEKNRLILKSKSDRIFKFLSENSQEINSLIRDLPGYMGSREVKD
ncbi:MAG: SEC-C domain-containing protein [Deltaproteobacteria bacterium]|nr:SEC-C domain-containing protein [Deltaproteobacteria bacterium]